LAEFARAHGPPANNVAQCDTATSLSSFKIQLSSEIPVAIDDARQGRAMRT